MLKWVILFLILSTTEISLSQTSYQKVLSVNGASTAGETMVRTNDGGFVIAGETNVNSNAESFLSKFDKAGNELWTSIYFDEQSHLQLIGTNDTEIYCNQFLKYLVATRDRGFLLGGGIDSSVSITYSNGVTVSSDYNRIYTIKTDSSGDVVWAKKFGLNELDWSDAAMEDPSTGNLIIAGSVNQAGFVSRDDLIMKLDATGNILWAKSFGGSFDEGVSDIIDPGKGNLLMCGTSESFSNNQDIYVVNFDSSGNEIWAKHYGSTGFDFGRSAMNADDGGFYFYGNAGNSPPYVCLFKTDSAGNVLWSNSYGNNALDLPEKLFKLDNGDFAATVSRYTCDYNAIVCEIDKDGNELSAFNYGVTGSNKNDFLNGIISDGAGNLICGATNSFSGNQFQNQVYFIRSHDGFQSDCNTTSLDYSPNAITLTTGDATSIPAISNIAGYAMAVTVLDSFLVADTLCFAVYSDVPDLSQRSPAVSIYPNPVSEIATIEIIDPEFTGGKLVLSDAYGRILLHNKIKDLSSELNVAGLNNGVYFLRFMVSSGKSVTEKIIVSH